MADNTLIPTPATPDVVSMTILIDGKQIPGHYPLLSMTIRKETNKIPTAMLHFDDGEASKATFAVSNTDDFIPGKKIEIQLGYKGENSLVFKGIIVNHGIRIRQAGNMLIVECKDECVRMTRGNKSRYYVDKKESEILEEVIAAYSLDKQVADTTSSIREVVQYDSTDWDFLLCRAEANGLLVNASDGKISIDKPDTGKDPALQVSFGSSLLEFDAEIDARIQSKGISTGSWNATDQQFIKADAAEPAPLKAGNLDKEKLADVLGGDPLSITHGGKVSQSELQAWADGRLMKERLAKIRGRVKFMGFSGIAPGMMIKLAGVGDRFAGNVYVSGVLHTVSKGNWETDVQFGINPEAIASQYALRPLPANGLLPGVGGLQIGVVTVLEKDPDGEERIKVRLPIVNTKEEGTWARIATLDAGKDRGTYYRPYIGDEVIVGFLGDDPRHPVVLGMCHSSANPSPEQAKDTNHHRGYVSKSKMKFTFDDEKKIITLETAAGNSLVMNEEEKSVILKDQHGNKIVMNEQGIAIESYKDLKLKAAKDINSEGMNVDIKANTGFKAMGNGSAELSSASTTVKGSASTVIQGGLVRIN